MTFRPAKWIVYSPVAVLPLLAALAINGDSADSHPWDAVQANWIWLLAALGLGIWFGWATSEKKDTAP
ncbi:MAG: hypothetical protein H7X89_15310 [Rhizobiales bacterium]|nr:hypothetical protein [Hyphomicrobiales bacterium]